jgi:sugar lactone lactonase YvrE
MFNNKPSAFLIGCLFFLMYLNNAAFAQQHRLEKRWVSDSLLKVPESVLADVKNEVLYVSNIDGLDPWGKDGKGSIAKLSLDGKIINAEWVRGLNAPKGMGLYKGNLYVADVDQVVEIDVDKGAIKKRIPVANAERLNDITVDHKGVVYISDSKGNRVYMLKGDRATPYVESLQGPNGLLWYKDNLYVLDKGALVRINYDRTLTVITEGMEGGTDGLQMANERDFIVSCWAGVIYYVYPDGTRQMLLDTRNEKFNSADIDFDAVNHILYVPTFWKNRVIAYTLQ